MKHFLIIFIFLITSSCAGFINTLNNPPEATPTARPEITEEEVEAWLERNKDRREATLKDLRTNECEEDSDCRKTCRDIYRTRKEADECGNLSIKKVEELEKIHKEFEKPSYDDLRKISSSDLEVYLDVGISAFNKLSTKWSRSQVKSVLEWIAKSKKAADALRSREEEDYELLSDLLEEMGTGSSDSAVFLDALQKTVADGDSLIELAIENENEEVLEWIHDFVEFEEVGDCDEEEITTVGCLKMYCSIADSMSDEKADEWLDFKYFTNYIEEIIEEKVNGDKNPDRGEWDTDDITDINEIITWWEDLC